jgi:hypothetical protein
VGVKACEYCGDAFKPNIGHQKLCAECLEIRRQKRGVFYLAIHGASSGECPAEASDVDDFIDRCTQFVPAVEREAE